MAPSGAGPGLSQVKVSLLPSRSASMRSSILSSGRSCQSVDQTTWPGFLASTINGSTSSSASSSHVRPPDARGSVNAAQRTSGGGGRVRVRAASSITRPVSAQRGRPPAGPRDPLGRCRAPGQARHGSAISEIVACEGVALCERTRVHADPTDVLDVLRRAGIEHRQVLGSGMEGTVVDLGGGTVAKVWSGRSVADLTVLREFHDAVFQRRPGPSAVAMPRILDLRDVEGTPVTIEERLSGEPVWQADGTSPRLTATHIDSMIEALAALAEIPGDPAFRTLRMLPDEPPFDPEAPFETELAALVTRRAVRFAAQLRVALPDVDVLLAQTVEGLNGIVPATPTLVHGDLIAANVMTSGGHASAALDFGFMTTAGDPVFDVAVAASTFDMYGPRAREVEGQLDRAFLSTFTGDHRRYWIYRAAYALTTACCYGTDLSEGHFAWCVGMLDRPDVRDPLRG